MARFRSLVLASRTQPAGDRDSSDRVAATSSCPNVAAVVITLNEEAQIEQCLDHLMASEPAYAEVVVCDGGSTDGTIGVVERCIRRYGNKGEKNGKKNVKKNETKNEKKNEKKNETNEKDSIVVRLVRSDGKGRALQLNAAARELVSDAVVFVHADSRPPLTAVRHARDALFRDGDETTEVGLLGFPTRIALFPAETPFSPAAETRILWLTTLHEYIAYRFYPFVFQPRSYLRGLRCLFGDQNLTMRLADWEALGGFDESLRIMEDLDMCLRVVERLGKRVSRCEEWGASSGRRIAAWGEGKATVIHFRIAVVWYAAILVERVLGRRWGWVRRVLRNEYYGVYGDNAR